MEERFKIGEISNTHGLKGEVKVYPTTDDIERFKKLKKCYLDTGKETLTLHVSGCRFFKQFAILRFKEFNDINQIERYKHCGLFVDREDAVPLAKDEYYIADLIGMQVFDEEEHLLGVLEDVLQTGANDVYVVKIDDSYQQAAGLNKQPPAEVLIPALKQCILELDVEQARMKVHLLEGLLDL